MDFTNGRNFLKSNWSTTQGPNFLSPQAQGVEMPVMQKKVKPGAKVIALPDWSEQEVSCVDFTELLLCRRSRRQYLDRALSLTELSYLLYSSDGLIEVTNDGKSSKRTAPSGGARHPFETYIIVNKVEGLEPGVYRYLFLTHQLEFCHQLSDQEKRLSEATNGQNFCGMAPATVLWSVIPERGEWRYHLRAHKLALLDIGHVCQNLYLACESIGLGICAIATYDQEKIDELLQLDGENEFVIYLAPVGAI